MTRKVQMALGGLMLASAIMLLPSSRKESSPALLSSTLPSRQQNVTAVTAPSAASAEGLAEIGTLWEPSARNSREQSRTSIPVSETAFSSIRSAMQGEQVTLQLSPRVKPLHGTVSSVATQDDGTQVRHLAVDGGGTLILQENEAAGFFLAQLYYPQLPIAYQFERTASGLTAERKLVSDLICADVEQDRSVDYGLPVAEAAKKQKSATTSLKLKGDLTVTVEDASITEGNSGTQNMAFTVTLSSPSRNGVKFTYSTSNGTATASEDYKAVSGTITIYSTARIIVPVIGDTITEGDETFTLNLKHSKYGLACATGTILNDDRIASLVATTAKLSSLPEATSVIYLDFDGATVRGTAWNDGKTITAGAANLTVDQIREIWNQVKEDYAPFDVNVTTDEAVYLAAAPAHRTRCIITPDNEWYGAAGGVSYTGSFTWTGDTPCWVFSDQLADSPRYIAEAISHECGHTLGLSHDGCRGSVYYTGQGSGSTGWAPIMGTGYYQPLVQWSKGEYSGANNLEDDLAIITGRNGFSYRSDDVGDTPETATPLTKRCKKISGSGVISTSSDIDVFSFTTEGGAVSLTASPDAGSPDLDIQMTITDAAGTTIAVVNPSACLSASVNLTLAAGTYYVSIDGVGEGNPASTGYSDYASLGAYTITGTAP
jgi:Calx-beta domain